MTLLVAACIALAAGCGPAPVQTVVQRFIPRHAETPFQLASISSRHEAATWDLGCGHTRVAASHDIRVVDPCARGGVLAESTGPDPWFTLDVDLDASRVDALELDGENLKNATVEVFWSPEGSSFSPERRCATLGGGRGATLDVGRLPAWKGRVRRLRVDPVAEVGRYFNLRRLTAVDRRVDAGRLSEASRVAWRVDLGHDAREALLAPPGTTHQLRLEAHEGASLRFGYGLQAGSTAPVQFQVRRRGAVDGPRVLWSDTVQPDGAGHWLEGSVDLDDSSEGTSLELATLEVGDAGPDLARGLPVWSDPTIVAGRRPGGRPNIILVSVDTLRADHVSAYGYHRQTTPHLDRWVREHGVVFENVVASAPWTLPSHASLFSGRDAVEHGVNFDDPVPDSFELLAEAVRDAGYRTVAFTGGAYLNPAFGLDQGVERYTYWPPGRSDADELESHVGRLLHWLDHERVEPFFVLLHTYEVHGPYRPRRPYFEELAAPASKGFAGVVEEETIPPAESEGWVGRSWIAERERADAAPRPLNPDEVQLAIDTYDAGVAFADAQLGRLLNGLASQGLDRRTLVVITSDHGEALGEKGLGGHLYLEDFNLMVPLLMALPGSPGAGTRVARQVRLVDVAPTILEAAGIRPLPAAAGVSLLPLINGAPAEIPDVAWSYAASSNRGLSLRVANRMKYTLNDTVFAPVHGAQQLFDLVADPAETSNLVADSASAGELRAMARSELAEGGTGWELEVSGPASGAFEARVTTDWLTPFRVKSADLPCDCITSFRAGAFDLRAPAGAHFVIFLPTLKARPVRVRGRTTGARGVQFDIQVPSADGRRTRWASYTDAGWTIGDAEPGPQVGVAVRWRGASPGASDRSDAADVALKEQMKALGYVQ